MARDEHSSLLVWSDSVEDFFRDIDIKLFMPVIYQFSLQARVFVPGRSFKLSLIGLYYPLNGVTNPQYKLLHFFTITFFNKEKALTFNRDRCCHLALCLQLIVFHYGQGINLPQKSTLQTHNSRVGSWPYPQIFEKAGKAFQIQTL
jgi:hypothetical protein